MVHSTLMLILLSSIAGLVSFEGLMVLVLWLYRKIQDCCLHGCVLMWTLQGGGDSCWFVGIVVSESCFVISFGAADVCLE